MDHRFFIAAGSIIGYILSRTVGLPLIPPEPENWFEPLGVVSLLVESAYVIIFVIVYKMRLKFAA